MREGFAFHEGLALYGLLAEAGCDIVLKLDRDGFVVHASAAASRLATDVCETLFAPHLADLAEPHQADKLRAFVDVVLRGASAAGWFEFGALTADGGIEWFTLQLRPLHDKEGATSGAIGIMRSIRERRVLEDRLFAAAMTDPFTGLANRRAFQAMLRHLARRRPGGSMFVLAIENLRAIGLRHGPSESDRLVGAVAGLLRDLLERDHILARIGDDRFAVLMPRDRTARAETVAATMLDAFDKATSRDAVDGLDVRASIGIAEIAGSPDLVLQRAEIAQLHAKARGHRRVEVAGPLDRLARRSA